MLLEFGTLARLTGNPVYEQKAMHAMKQLFGTEITLQFFSCWQPILQLCRRACPALSCLRCALALTTRGSMLCQECLERCRTYCVLNE